VPGKPECHDQEQIQRYRHEYYEAADDRDDCPEYSMLPGWRLH
jgi:hypothetical protein